MRQAKQRGWFERFLFSFMGPPQLGDPRTGGSQPEPAAVPCPKCGVPYDEHEVVRDPGLTYTRCPQA